MQYRTFVGEIICFNEAWLYIKFTINNFHLIFCIIANGICRFCAPLMENWIYLFLNSFRSEILTELIFIKQISINFFCI